MVEEAPPAPGGPQPRQLSPSMDFGLPEGRRRLCRTLTCFVKCDVLFNELSGFLRTFEKVGEGVRRKSVGISIFWSSV